MHLEAVIDRVWRSTWRLGSYEFRDALGGRDRASSGTHLEAEISSELRDAREGRYCVDSEMHLEAVIKRVGRYTWRP